MIASDRWNYDVGSFYLLKCDNMVMLMSVLERGQDYILYCMRGAQFSDVVENPVEIGAINEIIEEVFEPGKERPKKIGCINARFSNALYPIKEMNFPLYEKSKEEITCLNDPVFADTNKKWFMRIFAYKLNELFKHQAGEAIGFKYKIMKG